MNRSLRQRLGSAAIYLPIILALVWLHPIAFAGLLAITVILGGWELAGILGAMGWRVPRFLPAAAPLILALALSGSLGPVRVPLTAAIWLAGLAWLFFPGKPRRPGRGPGAWAVHLLGALYLGLLLACLGDLGGRPDLGAAPPFGGAAGGPAALKALFALAVVFACDTGAYTIGTLFGRHRLWPAVSPKKTWEGFVGGLMASVITAGLLAGPLVPGLGFFRGALLGLAAGVAAQLGDLVESRLKREADVKDAGGIIPGHGGILDRLDSQIFAAPIFALGLKLLLR
jgi:phosphatidate cytidylyltransferase